MAGIMMQPCHGVVTLRNHVVKLKFKVMIIIMYSLKYTTSTTKGILKFSAWFHQEYVSPTKNSLHWKTSLTWESYLPTLILRLTWLCFTKRFGFFSWQPFRLVSNTHLTQSWNPHWPTESVILHFNTNELGWKWIFLSITRSRKH